MELDFNLSAEALEVIKATRFRAKNAEIDTLLDLTIKNIIQKSEIFVGRTSNLFQNLPNTIVQRFFFLMTQHMVKQDVDPETINPATTPLIFLMLNASVEEFSLQEMSKGNDYYNENKLIAIQDNCILDHALEHCPHFKNTYISLDRHILAEDLALKISTRWQKLKILYLEGHCVIQDRVVHLLRKYLPQLESLDLIDLANDNERLVLGRFTMKSVKQFSQMKQLRVLSLRARFFQFTNSIWADVAGQTPALKRLNLSDTSGSAIDSPTFAKYYGKLYPDKPLHLGSFKFCRNFKGDWPQNLSVDHVDITDFENFSVLRTVPKNVKTLAICRKDSGCIYEAVEILGSTITSLTFSSSPVNIHRLLAACPKLERFIYDGQLDTRITLLLTPQRFKNFIRLRHYQCSIDENSTSCGALLKMVMLGSDKICDTATLKERCKCRLSAILEFLRLTDNNCKYYSKLKTVDLSSADFAEPKDIFELVYRLTANCPLLDEIRISYVDDGDNEMNRNTIVEECLKLKKVANDLGIDCLISMYSMVTNGGFVMTQFLYTI